MTQPPEVKDPVKKIAVKETKKEVKTGSINYTQTKIHQIKPVLMRQRRVISLEKFGPESETFRLLRTKVLKQLRDNKWNSIGITAPSQGAGKSMVAVNLAIAMAMEVNQTVLLVDLDLRRPQVHKYFDYKVDKGLPDCLLKDMPVADVLVHPSIERLVFLPGKGEMNGTSELLAGHKMREIVQELKQRYQSRIIIFDLPPILTSDDVLVSMDYFDSALLVVAEGENKPDDISRAIQLLSGTNLLGTVLNKAEKMPEYIGQY
ncbi:MAG: AAA family ATPase [Methyloprofundus sp.]|nr:AAA family ATPase [Methyloprofundus sp.]